MEDNNSTILLFMTSIIDFFLAKFHLHWVNNHKPKVNSDFTTVEIKLT